MCRTLEQTKKFFFRSETELVLTISLLSLNALKIKHQELRSFMCSIEEQTKIIFRCETKLV